MSNNEIILEALRQYEENNYESHDNKWQEQVGDLIMKYKLKILEESYE